MSARTGGPRRYVVKLGARSLVVTIGVAPNGDVFADVDGERVPMSVRATSAHGAWSLLLGDRSFDVGVHAENGGWTATVTGHTYTAEVADEALVRVRRADARTMATDRESLRAPMPGLVVALPASLGQVVSPGAPVVVLEAMKMQNELASRGGGIVAEIRVAVGDSVERGQLLAVVQPS